MEFTKEEIAFIRKKDELRVVTVSSKGWPQVTTVIRVFAGA